jgi:hypothetical protein
VVGFIRGGLAKVGDVVTTVPTVVNGNPAPAMLLDGIRDGVMALPVEGDRITGLYYVRNPEKLIRVGPGGPADPPLRPPAGTARAVITKYPGAPSRRTFHPQVRPHVPAAAAGLALPLSEREPALTTAATPA